MKQSQWIVALLVLAAMVFGITFLMNYSPDAAKTDTGNPGQQNTAWLTIPERRFPSMPKDDDKGVTGQVTVSGLSIGALARRQDGVSGQPPPPVEQEYGVAGYHDFWFINDGDRPVKTGLTDVSCSQCSGVEVFLMPPEWMEYWNQAHGAEKREVRLRNLAALATPGEGDDKRLRALEAAVEGIKLVAGQNEVTVEPGAVGKFRMHWNGSKEGAQRLWAQLWAGQRGVQNNSMRLEVHLLFLGPLRVAAEDRDRHLGQLNRSQLPYTTDFVLWSSTRDDLEFKRVGLANKPGALGPDPVVVGRPVRLSPEECKALERAHNPVPGSGGVVRADLEGKVRCAFRIPVTIRAKADDGEPIEIGIFRRRIEVVCADEKIPPEYLAVSGGIRGDVEVDEGGRIDFGSNVSRARGDARTISVHTDVAGLDLEVDEGRLPHFLKAELGKPEVKAVGAGEQRTWRLTVEVKPNQVSGPFPRDDSAYWDSAVYLKIRRKDDRAGQGRERVRIPVKGVATD